MRYTSNVIRDIYNDTKYPSANAVNQSIPDRENAAVHAMDSPESGEAPGKYPG